MTDETKVSTPTVFNFDAAMKAVAGNPYAVDFLTANRSRLEELGTEVGWAILLEIVGLFAENRNAEAWDKFYGSGASWATLAAGAAQDVTNTAAMAQRWATAGAFLRDCGMYATKALLAIVIAGFCG